MIVQREKFHCQELTQPDTFTTRFDLRLLLTEDTLEKKKNRAKNEIFF